MLAGVCVYITYCLYISLVIVTIRHRHYVHVLLLTKEDKSSNKPKRFSVNRYLYSCVAPMYREAWFGYIGFVVNDDGVNKVVYPYDRMRVFGNIKRNFMCLLKLKGDGVKTIIAINDMTYGDIVFEDLRKIYRAILIASVGGVILWKICSMYITF